MCNQIPGPADPRRRPGSQNRRPVGPPASKETRERRILPQRRRPLEAPQQTPVATARDSHEEKRRKVREFPRKELWTSTGHRRPGGKGGSRRAERSARARVGVTDPSSRFCDEQFIFRGADGDRSESCCPPMRAGGRMEFSRLGAVMWGKAELQERAIPGPGWPRAGGLNWRDARRQVSSLPSRTGWT
jgi:hypothetical protein